MVPLTKAEVLEGFNSLLQQKIDEAEATLKDTIRARDGESKSTAGDKYETGRAMAQQAQKQNEAQLSALVKQHHQISQIDPSKKLSTIMFGSLVQTNKIWFLVSIGIGNLKLRDENIYSISLASPLGKAFQNKTADESVDFNGKRYKILGVS